MSCNELGQDPVRKCKKVKTGDFIRKILFYCTLKKDLKTYKKNEYNVPVWPDHEGPLPGLVIFLISLYMYLSAF